MKKSIKLIVAISATALVSSVAVTPAAHGVTKQKVCVALDTAGINDKSFDGRGNYTLGVTEQIIFPEIDIDKVSKITGMDITFVTTANTDEEAYALLQELGMPFKNAKSTN